MFNITNLNGIIGDILNGIMTVIINVINSFFAPIFNAVLSVFYQFIFGSMCGILNACQKLFRIFAGTEAAIYTEAGKTAFGQSTVFGGTTGNMVFDFLLSQTVINVFTKIIVLAVALLIIFTIVAIIKNEYSTDVTKADNNKFKILASSGRALMGLLFVPVICILGIYASNQILIAVDSATNSGSSYMGTRVFVACSFNANRARIDEEFAKAMCIPKGDDGKNYSAYWNKVHNNYDFGVTTTGDSEQALSSMMEKVAQKIDTAFLANSKVPGGSNSWNNSDSGFGTGIVYEKMFESNIYPETFDCTNFWLTFYYYDLWEFDFVMAGIVIAVLSFLYIKLLITLAKRIYEIILLFIMSPVLLAMMPLDEGKAIKDWRTTFLQKVLMVYAPVVAMNLFLSIFGMFTSVDSLATITNALLEFTGIDLTASTASGLPLLLGAKGILMKAVPGLYAAYNLITCIFMIAGVMVVDQTSSWVAKWIGAEDAIKSGKEQYKAGKSMMNTGLAVGAAALTGGASLAAGAFRLGQKGASMVKAGKNKLAQMRKTRGARKGLKQANQDLDADYATKSSKLNEELQAANEKESAYRTTYGNDADFKNLDLKYNQLIENGMTSAAAAEKLRGMNLMENSYQQERFINAISGADIVKDKMLQEQDKYQRSKEMLASDKDNLGGSKATRLQYEMYKQGDVHKILKQKERQNKENIIKSKGGVLKKKPKSSSGGGGNNNGGKIKVSRGGSGAKFTGKGGEEGISKRSVKEIKKERAEARAKTEEDERKMEADKAEKRKKENAEIYKKAGDAMEELERNRWKPD